jgi:hypothetical protein
MEKRQIKAKATRQIEKERILSKSPAQYEKAEHDQRGVKGTRKEKRVKISQKSKRVRTMR